MTTTSAAGTVALGLFTCRHVRQRLDEEPDGRGDLARDEKETRWDSGVPSEKASIWPKSARFANSTPTNLGANLADLASDGTQMGLWICPRWAIVKPPIAIHGLGGHRMHSFEGSNRINWLRDFLPKRLPRSRIFTYGYDSSRAAEYTDVQGYARNLVIRLALKRLTTEVS